MIEKVHGLHATSITLNDRFTFLAEAPGRINKPKKRNVSQSLNKAYNLANKNIIQQIAYHLEQASKQTVKQGLGLRRYGSESNLFDQRRTNSSGNLKSVTDRVSWRQSSNSLSSAILFNNFGSTWRRWGFRRRGARVGLTRERIRGKGGQQQTGKMFQNTPHTMRRGHFRGRGGFRAQGRGAITPKKTVPTKEELDFQLEQYMSSTKSALDKQLDDYMRVAMECE
ncbi:unnamed protein product [Leptosia nina]|uniref:Chromatin target of PRMT1 protein C-terminal domain-containing protein n=1 Tax=Leptosia nina TaxID=320188 RepID=A0AAV1JA54_9NEOP